MLYPRSLAPWALFSWAVLSLSSPLAGQAPDAQGLDDQAAGDPLPGDVEGSLTREEMWSAPTKDDWAKPCLITWQRTYEDAVQVSKETGKAILVCINMDGEIASEHYAGIRYRQQAVADLYEPYVCVIASTYRHNPRDHDEWGQRILCPRFGSVTCGEHIRIEPGLFTEFLDDTRVAPRHIMLEDGKQEQYDVYYAFDTVSVFNTIREGIRNRPAPVPTVERGDQGLLERVESRDVLDRSSVEQAYIEGSLQVRRELLVRATANNRWSQVDLLRLALFGRDAELSQLAWRSLLETKSTEALPLVSEVLNFDLEPDQRDEMIECLVRLGSDSPQAQRLARVYRGLADPPQGFDGEAWRVALENAAPPEPWPDPESLRQRAEETARALASGSGNMDALLAHSAALYDLAYQSGFSRKERHLSLEDSRVLALEAKAAGAQGWEVNSLLAATAKGLSRPRKGYAAAQMAMKELPEDPGSWRAKETLALFAEARQRAIFRAMKKGGKWPTGWLSDAHTAFGLLALHPFGTAADLTKHHDYLDRLKAKGYAGKVLDQGIERFGDSPKVHARLRARLLAATSLESLEGLERSYEKLLANALQREPQELGELYWYGGYASMVAAEFHRRAADHDGARASYGRAIEQFEISMVHNPGIADSSDHFIAMAHAGLARIALEAQQYPAALDRLVACFGRSPGAANSLDGLGITAVMTATTLGARLTEAGLEPQAVLLREALGDLPPELLQAPGFEKVAPQTGEAGRKGLVPRPRGER